MTPYTPGRLLYCLVCNVEPDAEKSARWHEWDDEARAVWEDMARTLVQYQGTTAPVPPLLTGHLDEADPPPAVCRATRIARETLASKKEWQADG